MPSATWPARRFQWSNPRRDEIHRRAELRHGPSKVRRGGWKSFELVAVDRLDLAQRVEDRADAPTSSLSVAMYWRCDNLRADVLSRVPSRRDSGGRSCFDIASSSCGQFFTQEIRSTCFPCSISDGTFGDRQRATSTLTTHRRTVTRLRHTQIE